MIPETSSSELLAVADAYVASRDASEALRDVRRELEEHVGSARAAGHTWSEIAAAAGVTEQAVMKAHRRYLSMKEHPYE